MRRALERVGEEVSGILQRAHDTGSRITAQSRSEAEDRLEAARQEAAQIMSRAEERVRELDAETDRIWAERQRIVEDTRELARELVTLTDSAADRFPPDAGADAGGVPDAVTDAAMPGLEAVPPAGTLPEEDARGEPAPIEEVLPDEVAVDGNDPDVEPTAILPVVDPPDDDTDPGPR